MSDTRWESCTTFLFIDEYKKQICLWNSQHELYKNRHARNKAYRRIINTMGQHGIKMSVDAVRTKIRSIRTTYFGEMKKIDASKKDADGDGEVYIPTLRWYNAMSFISDTSKDASQEKETNNMEVSNKA